VTVAEWLRAAAASSAGGFERRVASVLGDPAVSSGERSAAGVVAVCGVRMLSELLRKQQHVAPSALDLLTADALVTSCLPRACGEDPSPIEDLAAGAMQRYRFDRMIDLHCHLLPGVGDDGAPSP